MKLELHYHWRQYDWEDEGHMVCATHDLAEFDHSCILLKVIEIEAPDVAPPSHEQVIKHRTAKLKEEKEKLLAETQIKLNVIEDKIRQLQSIEYKKEPQ